MGSAQECQVNNLYSIEVIDTFGHASVVYKTVTTWTILFIIVIIIAVIKQNVQMSTIFECDLYISWWCFSVFLNKRWAQKSAEWKANSAMQKKILYHKGWCCAPHVSSVSFHSISFNFNFQPILETLCVEMKLDICEITWLMCWIMHKTWQCSMLT